MENYTPLISGLIGALIGAMASIITIIVQSRAQDKRERMRMAAQLAFEDFKIAVDLAMKSGARHSIQPPAVYLHYHMKLMNLLEKDSLSKESLRQITKENEDIMESISSLNLEHEHRFKKS